MQATRILNRMRADFKLDEPQSRGGVLVIPAAPSLAEWERRTAEDQRRYREQRPEDFERVEEELKAQGKKKPEGEG
jgi:hypothetical protein